MTTLVKKIKGGEFIIKETEAINISIPEERTEEQNLMADMGRDFLNTEVIPNMDRIDSQEEGLMVSLLDKAGELGLLATSIPEKYNGFGKDFI